MKNLIRRNKQAGFTLIEIAIVLIIIGLLLGGVLKGQTLVKNSKIKRISADANAFIAAANAYVDSYWALPGDDVNAATRWSASFTSAATADGDGVIDEGADGGAAHALFIPTATGLTLGTKVENAEAVEHLRCAELLKGACALVDANNELPKNSVGGQIGIDDGSGGQPNVLALTTKAVCQTNIESDYATIYDTQFDDGNGLTGTIRGENSATYGQTTVDTATYAATGTYFVCASF